MTTWDDFMEQLDQPPAEQPGTRVALVAMPDDPNPPPVGTHGTVQGHSNAAQLWVTWDTGQRLALVPEDTYRVVSDEIACQLCGKPARKNGSGFWEHLLPSKDADHYPRGGDAG